MNSETQQIFDEAVTRNTGVVFSLPSAGLLRHHKSRFLAHDDEGFWIEGIPSEGVLIDSLIQTGQPAGISFKNGIMKVMLASPILRREPAFRINASLTVEAVLLKTPQEIHMTQRRSNYRVRLSEESELSVRVWRINATARLKDRPYAHMEIRNTIRDISLGGVGLNLIGQDGQPPKICDQDRLRIQINYRVFNIVVEGQARHLAKTDDPSVLRAGIQFAAMDKDIEGRQALAVLTKIVGEMQREEIRRHRLGLCKIA
jgi:hypothetical protein